MKKDIYCVYHRNDGSAVIKLVPITQRFVNFDEYEFEIIPSESKLYWRNKGWNFLVPRYFALFDFAEPSHKRNISPKLEPTYDTAQLKRGN